MIDPIDRPRPGPMTFAEDDTVILCEGRDECAVLRTLCTGWKRQPKIGICQEGQNEEEELKNIAIQVRMHRIAVLGLVFDAERDRASRKAQIEKWLKDAGFTPPKDSLQLRRSSLDGVEIRTAYLINPHGKKTGAIETYFLPQIQRSKHWLCIEALLQCYAERNPTNVLRDKLIVRTFIAHRNGRNTGLNAAFKSKILNHKDKSLDPVRKFLSLLRKASPAEQDRKLRAKPKPKARTRT